MKGYVTVSGESTAEYVEKRSRFIAMVRHCDSEEDALCFLEELRSRYWDAKHICYAYTVEKGVITRFSDDGEPHGTAGKPILDVITGNGLTNLAVAVVRYFGGTLLGTGGLVRAYSKSAGDALKAAEICEMVPGVRLVTQCPYPDHGKLVSLISAFGGHVEEPVYETGVTLTYLLRADRLDEFLKVLSEAFSARLCAEVIEEGLYPAQK